MALEAAAESPSVYAPSLSPLAQHETDKLLSDEESDFAQERSIPRLVEAVTRGIKAAWHS